MTDDMVREVWRQCHTPSHRTLEADNEALRASLNWLVEELCAFAGGMIGKEIYVGPGTTPVDFWHRRAEAIEQYVRLKSQTMIDAVGVQPAMRRQDVAP